MLNEFIMFKIQKKIKIDSSHTSAMLGDRFKWIHLAKL